MMRIYFICVFRFIIFIHKTKATPKLDTPLSEPPRSEITLKSGEKVAFQSIASFLKPVSVVASEATFSGSASSAASRGGGASTGGELPSSGAATGASTKGGASTGGASTGGEPSQLQPKARGRGRGDSRGRGRSRGRGCRDAAAIAAEAAETSPTKKARHTKDN